jgi:hypothetical protein
MYFLTNVNLIVPVVAAVAVIVIAIAVICVLRHNRHPVPFPKGNYNLATLSNDVIRL